MDAIYIGLIYCRDNMAEERGREKKENERERKMTEN
jgi:hypothetical protein